MAILILQHAPEDNPARLGQVLRDGGHRLRVVALHQGDPPPSDLDDVDGLISMGGPMNVDQIDQIDWIQPELDLIRTAHSSGIPVAGVCLGAQLIATALGGKVESMESVEYGWHPVRLTNPGTIDPMLCGIPWSTIQFHAHGQQVTTLPDGAVCLASSKQCPHQAFKVNLTTYAIQYHFEWDLEDIEEILKTSATKNNLDLDGIKAQNDQFYNLYCRLGERMASNLANLLFPLDKRLGHTKGPVANYHASSS